MRHPKRKALIACLAVLSLGLAGQAQPSPAAAAAAVEFHVSTAGSDTTGDGSSSRPWASLQKARDSIRPLLGGMTTDIVVNIAPGDYHQTSTISFTNVDSGQNGHTVSYRASGGVGSARFIGGQPVSGWSAYQGAIYRANIGVGRSVNTLYENGNRATLARTPNRVYNPAFPMSQAPYLNSTGAAGSHRQLQYPATGLSNVTWSRLAGATVHMWPGGNWDWFTDKTPIASVNTSTRTITLSQDVRYPIGTGSRFFVQGMLELLDQPGEFYYDAATGYLYYNARYGAIAEQTIIVPAVQRLFSFIGQSPSNRVHHVKLDGLTIAMTDFTGWFRHGQVNAGDSGENHQYPAYDRQINMAQHRTGMVFMQNTNNITITNSHLTNSGYSAIYMLFANSNNFITNNWIDHIGHSGVYLEGPYPGEGDLLNQNTIDNSLIERVGELVGSGAGVFIASSGRNRVSHSEIAHSPRYAVAIDVDRDYDPSSNIYSRNNIVEYLRVHDMAQDSGDTAPIYSFGLSDTQPYVSNTYRNLTINGVRADPSMTDWSPGGIYMDNDTYGQVFSNIQVSDVQGQQFGLNDSGSHILTNVSWAAGFNESAMDYGNIGVNSSFPYRGGSGFVGDFSNGFTNWSAVKGTPALSSSVSHSGTPSFAQSGDTSVIHNSFVASQNGRVSLWLYDNTANTSVQAMARVDNGTWSETSAWRGLGVSTSVSATNYVYRVGSTYTVTPVARSTGWHELAWDYTSGNGVQMSIDGVRVANATGVNRFNQIAMGDWWADGIAGPAYWGDIAVSGFAQDFDRLGPFVAAKGTPTLSTARAKSGPTSYLSNQDTSVITATLEGKRYEVASLWFYDDAADTSARTMARVDEGGWDNSNTWRGMGIDTSASATNYVYRIGTAVSTTSVRRSTGWHRLTWDYRSGSGVRMYIDNTLVATQNGVRQFKSIAMGDWWADGNTSSTYWDLVTVSAK